MLKKFIACGAAGMLAVSSIAASAAPVAFDSAARAASSVTDAEELGEGTSEVWLLVLFALAAAGIVVLIQGSEGSVDDLPASP